MQKIVYWVRFGTVRRTSLIALGCASFLGGLGLVQLGVAIVGWGWIVLALLLLILCLKKRPLALIAVVVVGFILGLWRGSDVASTMLDYSQFIDRKVSVQGKVSVDPSYDDKGRLDMRLNDVTINGTSLPGTVRVRTFAPVQPHRGDTIRAEGKLYEGFGNYQAAIYYGDVTPLTQNGDWVDGLRRQFAAVVYTNMPDPQASLGLGFLVGLKSVLPDTLDAQLKVLGLTHIVVASGYNLTVLVRLSRRLLEKQSRYQTIAVSAFLITGFVAVTGFSPSMSRAALVTGLALAAWYYGRRIHPVVLLLFAAAITAAVNPIFLWSDIGWWLSFLAFAGVMLLAPLLQRRLFGEQKPKLIGQVVLETLSAQLLTLPLILFVFGDFSVLALLANVLIVPLIPLAMLLTFIGGLAGLIVPAVAPYIALPATGLLSFMTEIIRLLSQIEWASVPFGITLPVMLGCYGAIAGAGMLLWRKLKFDYRTTSVIE